MTRAKQLLLTVSLALTALACTASVASAAPVLRLQADADSYVKPGAEFRYTIYLDNVGDEPTSGEHRLRAELPAGVTAVGIEDLISAEWSCTGDGPSAPPSIEGASTVECLNSDAGPLGPLFPVGFFPPPTSSGQGLVLVAEAEPVASGELTARFEVAGANATRADGSACGQAPAYGPPPCATTAQTTTITTGSPQFGIEAFDLQPRTTDDSLYTTAGGHPEDVTTYIDLRTAHHSVHGQMYPVEPVKDIIADLPPGLIGNASALPQCTTEQLAQPPDAPFPVACPGSTQVGMANVRLAFGTPTNPPFALPALVYNMVPPAGAPARFAFNTFGTIVLMDPELNGEDGEYKLSVASRYTTEGAALFGTTVTFWGSPADPAHDSERFCPEIPAFGCSSTAPNVPLLRMPTSCPEPGEGLQSRLRANSWFNPGHFDAAASESHEAPGYPAEPADWGAPQGTTGCENVDVEGSLEAKPTTPQAETSSGLDVHLEVPNPGLMIPGGISSSDLKKVRVSLPQGMTINPSQAEGLGACSPAQYESTELSHFPTPGKGCPDDSKIGSVVLETPLLEEKVPGDVYIAEPFNNPFGSLLAIYVVLKEPNRGILVKMAGKVETDEKSGRIVTTFDDLPELPFSSFDFKFREGARAPLVTPPACGTYTTITEIWGHSDPDGPPFVSESSFTIDRGIGSGACPSGGIPPFRPGLIAGTRNNAGGSYSPFDVRLFRTDAEQHFTNFSIKLPPGVVGKLAGVPFCSEADIAWAKTRSGAEELASSSCPQASEIGRTLVGAGVGSVQTHVPGKIYLAGPYNGSALSIVSITAAKVGPFDLGTVAIRLALRVDPETAEVFVDPTGSDPLPHIIDGIPTKLRDIRAYVDRLEFVRNPTSCDPTSTASTVLGSGFGFDTTADDEPVTVSTRFQAANCANLAFKPALKLNLKGATKRGGHPKLRAELRMRPGMANIARAQVTLPRSAFLDQSHIGTVCTRVQYAADQCPPRSVYGYARGFTPLLDEPIEGPVYLRSSSHKLPDLVAALKSGKIEIDLVGRIDSLKGRIRSTFESVPDAPVSKFVLNMQGGRKGLIVNSADLCKGTHRAIAAFDGHNGKIRDFNPVVRPQCSKAKRKAAKRRSAR